MNQNDNKIDSTPQPEKKVDNINIGYPLYPSKDDIYSKSKEERDLDPENPSKKKVANPAAKAGKQNEKDFLDDMVGGDLDVPGSEADDNDKSVGNEDEENNYYSIGGDDHNSLEEDHG